jgi:ankyrin repeat protein
MTDACWHQEEGEDGVQFIEAAKNGDADELRRLIRSDKLPYINHTIYMSGYYGQPALHCAIENDNPECMDVLLNSQVDLSTLSDYTACDGVNALTLCVILDRPVAFQKLLKAGASVHGVDAIGSPTMVWAASHNRLNYAAELICNGADVNAKTADGETPLYFAKLHNFVQMQELLLKMGATDDDDNDDNGGDKLPVLGQFKPSMPTQQTITKNDNRRKLDRIQRLCERRYCDKLRILDNRLHGFYENESESDSNMED